MLRTRVGRRLRRCELVRGNVGLRDGTPPTVVVPEYCWRDLIAATMALATNRIDLNDHLVKPLARYWKIPLKLEMIDATQTGPVPLDRVAGRQPIAGNATVPLANYGPQLHSR